MHLIIAGMLAWEILGAPDLDGLATWYGIDDGSGAVFRSGEPFRLDAPYCAVDAALWHEYEGARLLVMSDAGLMECTVADSGYLANAGEFWYNGNMWVAGEGVGIVVDIPHDAFVRTWGDDTQRVQVWRLE